MDALRLETRAPGRAFHWRWPFRRPSLQAVVFGVLFFVIAGLVLVPLVLVVLTAPGVGPTAASGTQMSLQYISRAWTSPATWAVIGNTLVFAFFSTMLSMIIGVFFAFMVERTDMPMKNFAYAVVPLTIAMPGRLYGSAWVLLLSPRIGLFNLGLLGLFGREGGLLTSWAGIGFHRSPVQ